MVDKFISIKEASLLFGVTTTTLRRWGKNGSFSPQYRTIGNHRRYKLSVVLDKINPGRVDSKKNDLLFKS